ncbi:MAG: hypothetical protein A2029_08465, partial [Chloroflexi bacterium RBG_19FT_COMBO_47_9]
GLDHSGAYAYFISHTSTFWIGMLGFLKGIIWSATLVYEIIKYLNMYRPTPSPVFKPCVFTYWLLSSVILALSSP